MTDPDAPLDDTPGKHAADERPPSMLERWAATEPLRLAIYPTAVAVAGLLVGYGFIAPEQTNTVATVVAAVLGGLGPVIAGEIARRRTWAPATVRRTVDEWREHEYGVGFTDGTELAERSLADPRHTVAEIQAASALELKPEHDEPEPTRPVDTHPPTTEIPRVTRGVPPSAT